MKEDKMNLIIIKCFCSAKDTVERMKSQLKDLEEIFGRTVVS